MMSPEMFVLLPFYLFNNFYSEIITNSILND